MGDAEVELYIDRGDAKENKRIFDALYDRKDGIEQVFGDQLQWKRLEEYRASGIGYMIPGGGLRDQERWTEIQERIIDAMVRLEKALAPEIQRLE